MGYRNSVWPSALCLNPVGEEFIKKLLEKSKKGQKREQSQPARFFAGSITCKIEREDKKDKRTI